MRHLLVKQPAEKYPFAIDFTGQLPDGTTIASGLLLAANLRAKLTTTVAAPSAVGATTLDLIADPGAGAILMIDAGLATEERAQVRSVVGAGPYTCTLTAPLGQVHAGAAVVAYHAGTTAIIASDNATITVAQAIAQVVGGQDGSDYLLAVLVTLSDGSVLEEDVLVRVRNV